MNAKKIVSAGLALVMVAGISVAGTLAYLTSTDSVKNTFTVGNVGITLDELNVDGKNADGEANADMARDDANAYHLFPGENYVKDPTIHVTEGSEESWVFVKVENGLGTAEVAGNTTGKTIADQMTANGWVPAGVDNVYFYGITGNPTEVTDQTTNCETAGDLVVFREFKIDGALEGDDAAFTGLNNAEIVVTAYAVQAEGMDSVDDALVALGLKAASAG